jgi:hypothetical protein
MATDPNQERVAEAVALARRALERAAAFGAAGGEVAPEITAYAEELVKAAVTVLAVASGTTPREISERLHTAAMSDHEWRAALDELRGGGTLH